MTINRYTPNPHLIAPSTEQRMVVAADGEFISLHELSQLQMNKRVAAVLEALAEWEKSNSFSQDDAPCVSDISASN
jgi:hypothetical protein